MDLKNLNFQTIASIFYNYFFRVTDNRITNFSRAAFENLTDKEKLKVNETSQDLFNLFQFAMFYKITNNMKLHFS